MINVLCHHLSKVLIMRFAVFIVIFYFTAYLHRLKIIHSSYYEASVPLTQTLI